MSNQPKIGPHGGHLTTTWEEEDRGSITPAPQTVPQDVYLDQLAEAVLNVNDPDEADFLAVLRPLRTLLRAEVWVGLALRCEVCPMHVVDIQICADDDEPDCKRWWK